ncbi:hypothetical protein GGR54DRAFT_35675 [Hypoxylon sp. NC1633]|nr:hypothetical protein GGR54DRAFT_35675 [Hypoxylon sp. NC1633]
MSILLFGLISAYGLSVPGSVVQSQAPDSQQRELIPSTVHSIIEPPRSDHETWQLCYAYYRKRDDHTPYLCKLHSTVTLKVSGHSPTIKMTLYIALLLRMWLFQFLFQSFFRGSHVVIDGESRPSARSPTTTCGHGIGDPRGRK